MHKEHFLLVNSLIFYRSLDHKSFKTMAMYLLYSATYSQVPLSSVIDTRIKEQLQKSGSAKNIAFWNWTPLQKSLLDAHIQKLIMTSHWSTGKTRILFVKALMLAKDGKFVIFILHYSQINEESKDSKDEEKIMFKEDAQKVSEIKEENKDDRDDEKITNYICDDE